MREYDLNVVWFEHTEGDGMGYKIGMQFTTVTRHALIDISTITVCKDKQA